MITPLRVASETHVGRDLGLWNLLGFKSMTSDATCLEVFCCSFSSSGPMMILSLNI